MDRGDGNAHVDASKYRGRARIGGAPCRQLGLVVVTYERFLAGSLLVATILLVAESATNAELLRADVKNARFECPGKDGLKVALRNGRGEGAPGELPSEFYLKQVVFGD